MRLLYRILLAPTVAALAIVICTVVSILALNSVVSRFDELQTTQLQSRALIGEILLEAETVKSQVFRTLYMMETLSPEERKSDQEKVKVVLASIDQRLVQLTALLPADKQSQITEPKEKIATFKTQIAQAFTMMASSPAIGATMVFSAQRVFMIASEKLVVLSTQIRADADASAGVVKSTSAAARTGILVAAAIAIAASLLLAWRMSINITTRLRRAIVVSEAISRGELDVQIDNAGNDEVGALMKSLEQTVSTLNRTLTDINAAAREIHTASSEIAVGSQDLSARTEQAASSLEQTSSAMEQLTDTVKHNVGSVREADQLAGVASEVAVRGGAIVDNVVTTMEGINAASRRIGDIIGVIDGIAFQTNILALNAAVEAARAGEQGRGFAVVASEVRSLAQRSAQAAKEIKSLIDDSADKADGGTRLVGEAGTTMTEVVAAVKRVNSLMSQLSSANAEQATSISEVGGAINHLDQMTQQNAALVEQSAAAAESLKEQAGRMAAVVSTFRLRPA